ncbi:DUF2281 domain-containing protein [Synechococcus sp. PCC 6312]|uniref:DUF2281 domain-containing protein n=1 Tax=Synechococcus sp. (strain ATCC 27167 / PCC 6312) TaxID=195253 RepID=UPI00029EEB65|nr:DUF2281 domain-containing protein [Synechococcus sp. PCC 6312]AFY61188.1 Protein of unknown function (DUF2281) [Synechococcus sp. PCC 6312]
MTTAEKLHQLIATLSEKQIREVLRFAELIQQKQLTTTQSEQSRAIQTMRGLLKTDHAPPTDEEVIALLEQRRMDKYL